MNTGLILHTLLGLLLLLIPAGSLYLLERKKLMPFGFTIVRMVVQLLVLCLMMWALMRVDSPWLSLLWLLLVVIYSAWIVIRRCKLKWRKFLPAVSLGLLAGVLFVGLWILVLVLPVRVFDARWFVPVMALLTAHSTAMMIRGMSTYVSALNADEQQYEFLRGNGVSHFQALRPFLRRSLLAVVSPTITNLSVLCLTSMPLLLCGIFLGGVSPRWAFLLMLHMIIGCVSASVLSLTVALFLADKSLFDKFGKLIIVLSLIVTMMACKGNKDGQATDQQDTNGLYASGNAAKTEVEYGNSSDAGSTGRKAKTVVMYEMPAKLADRPEQILRRRGYTTSYNSMTKTPNWVAWHLTKAHTYGSYQRSQEVFAEDESVKAPRATDNDYYSSRYDRGHMCPAGDNKWDGQAMTESFLFTNVCPQNHGLNKYEWNDLEILCRDWARKYGAVDIVCGPLYSSLGGRYSVGKVRQDTQKTIGRNKVWVPDAFFKVILCRQGSPKAIGFVYRNEGKKQRMEEAVCSVDEVEAMTGIDFFPALDDTTEDRVEASVSLSEW